MDLERHFAFQETFNLRFIQAGYDDHSFSELPARGGCSREKEDYQPSRVSLGLQGPSCQQVDDKPSRLEWRVACQ